MPSHRCDAVVLVYPLDAALGSVVAPVHRSIIREKVDTAYSGLFARLLFNVLKFSFVVLDEYIRAVPAVIVMLSAIFLLTCDDVASVLVKQVAVQSLCRVRGLRVTELLRG